MAISGQVSGTANGTELTFEGLAGMVRAASLLTADQAIWLSALRFSGYKDPQFISRNMDRRAFLRQGGAVGSLLIAGCSSDRDTSIDTDSPPIPTTDQDDQSVRVPVTVNPATSTELTAAPDLSHRERYARYLSNQEIEVEQLAVLESDALVILRYVTTKSGSQELGAEIGAIAGGYLREVEAGWEIAQMDATILDQSATAIAQWYVESAWVQEYRREEISGEELSLRILNTVERVE